MARGQSRCGPAIDPRRASSHGPSAGDSRRSIGPDPRGKLSRLGLVGEEAGHRVHRLRAGPLLLLIGRLLR